MKTDGEYKAKIDDLEKREEISKMRLEENRLIEKIKEEAKKWAVYTIALRILEKAKQRYEKERQPAVIKQSQLFFKKITLGNYKQIFSPLEGNYIEVIGKNDERKMITQLSRGTAEQLYLALRFGLIREFSEHSGVNLPIIMDDIFVNFDNHRLKAAISTIKELSDTHQILFFTCHPEISNLIRSSIKETEVISLS